MLGILYAVIQTHLHFQSYRLSPCVSSTSYYHRETRHNRGEKMIAECHYRFNMLIIHEWEISWNFIHTISVSVIGLIHLLDGINSSSMNEIVAIFNLNSYASIFQWIDRIKFHCCEMFVFSLRPSCTEAQWLSEKSQ